MEIVNLIQGTPEWHAHRAKYRNASDAPAMMGCSPYKSRTELLAEASTGMSPDVDHELQHRFDAGHRFEALARPLAEKIIGDDLYPCVGVAGRFSASFDGLTMDESIAFEHKTLNAGIREALRDADDGAGLPLHYRVQMEHQMHVSGAEKTLFMASSWDAEDRLIEEVHTWYYPDAELRAAVLQGWEQFDRDLADFVPVQAQPKLEGFKPENLPALLVEVTGQVTTTNLPAFKAHAMRVLEGIKTDLQTDQDFADAEATVKWCSDVETRLAAAKQHALSQTASIEELFRTLDDIAELTRKKRLNLSKLVTSRKDEIKLEMVTKARQALADHIAELNAALPVAALPVPNVDFGLSIKGKRNLDSMQDAIDTALATVKAEATSASLVVATNMVSFAAVGGDKLATLFPDLKTLILKPGDDFKAVVATRIREHEEAVERKRLADEAAKTQAQVAAPEPQSVTEVHIANNGVRFIRPAAEPSPNPFDSEPAPAPQPAAANTPPTLRIGEICRRTRVTVGAELLGELGFQAVTQGASKLYHEADFPRICRALAKHFEGLALAQAA